MPSLALPKSYDAEKRTVDAVFSTGAAVDRAWYVELLDISSNAVDLSRVRSGTCSFLDSHRRDSVAATIGTVIAARIAGGKLSGTIQFTETAAGRAAESMVARGELRGVSIGYAPVDVVAEAGETKDIVTVRQWVLMELSLTPIPADPGALIL